MLNGPCERRIGSQGLNTGDMVLNKISKLFLAEEVFAKMCHEIAHVRYIKILTSLRGFLVIFLYLVWFSLCSSLFR